MKSYLTYRQHLTKLNGVKSELKVLAIGVPQGSILGPLLFLIFINDLPNVSKFDVKLFADDTFLSLSSNDIKYLEKTVNLEMKKMSKWFTQNELTLNVEKSKFMLIKRRNSRLQEFTLKYNGKKMERCYSYKYLGVHLDEKLSWKNHVNYLCEKLSKMCGLFAKLRHTCDINLLKPVYYALALVESHLQYCNLIWGKANDNVLQPLMKLQDKILRIICFLPNTETCSEQAYQSMGLLNVKQLHKFSMAKFMFKFKMNKLPKCFENFFKTRNDNQRYLLINRVKQY